MPHYTTRTYRGKVRCKGLVSFNVTVKETDLWVSAVRDLTAPTRDLIFDCRHQIETYINSHPDFADSLTSYGPDPYAPPLVKEMIEATARAGVGPMASVAGAIAQRVGRGLLELSDQVIVENGGDIYLKAKRPLTVAVFAGTSPLSERFALKVPVERMPLGVCSSSGTVGHSLSLGAADAVCLLSRSAALADGAATALGNRIKQKRDLSRAAEWARGVEGILGGLIILGANMASWGDIELMEL